MPFDHFIGVPAREQPGMKESEMVALQRAGFGNPSISDAESGGS